MTPRAVLCTGAAFTGLSLALVPLAITYDWIWFVAIAAMVPGAPCLGAWLNWRMP